MEFTVTLNHVIIFYFTTRTNTLPDWKSLQNRKSQIMSKVGLSYLQDMNKQCGDVNGWNKLLLEHLKVENLPFEELS